MKKIIRYLHKQEITRKNLIFLMIFYFFIALLSLAQPEVLKRATTAIVNENVQALINTMAMAVAAAVLYMCVTYGKDIYTIITKNKYEKMLSSLLLDKLIETKMSKLQQKQFGDVSTILIRNIENYVASTVSAVSEFSVGIMSLALTMFYMLIIEWRLALCVLAYNFVIRFFAVFAERKIKQKSINATKAMRLSGNYLVSLLSNMLTVHIYSNRDFLNNLFNKKEQKVRKANWISFVWINGFQDSIWAFSKLAEFIIIYGAGAWLILGNLTNISILLTFVFANDLFTIGINNISNYLTLRAESEAYQESLDEILMETELEKGSYKTAFENTFPIRFESVSFSYGDKKLLDNVSFTIKYGEKILLQGENGTGKSTILKLMAGLYRPDSGSIFYGNKNIKDMHISCLADTYGYISQHSNILEGDVFTNIALNENGEINKAKEILRYLKLLHVQDNNPKSLSQGEQQRLNIGRVFYRNKPVFIMGDEIFSNIDEKNRKNIIEIFERSFKEVTIILITHEQTGFKFDRILTVCEGKVNEEVQYETI